MEMPSIRLFYPPSGNYRMVILVARGLSPPELDWTSTIPPVCAVKVSFQQFCRVQMSDLSTFQTTSFHTRLSFLDEENYDSLLDDDEVQEEEDEKYEDDYNKCGPAGNNQVLSESCWMNVQA